MKTGGNMKKSIYTLSLVLILGSGCKVAEKEFRKGNYDEAIDICVKKLIDNPDKAEYILILEEAYYRANSEDLSMIEMLNKEGRPDRWEEIYHIYESVYRRQNKIQPLMPIYLGTEERDAEFKFVNAVDGLNTAKKNAAAYWYADATQKIETKDVHKSREAYYELQKINEFYDTYKDVDDLIKIAKTQGMSDVLFTVKNATNSTLSYAVTHALTEIEVRDPYGSWYVIHTKMPESAMEFTVKVNIKFVDAYPEKITNNQYAESKEIIDGYEFVYDGEGNMVKDSMGNPIKVPDYKTVTAYVTETWQEKAASVGGELVYLDESGKVIRTIAVKGETIFRNYYATATGYYDALSQQSKEKIGGKPVPFPGDEKLILDAIYQVECNVNDIMEDYNEEYLNL